MSTDVIPSDDLTSVFDVLNSLSTLQRRAIVRPQNPPEGIAGFLFDVPEEDEVSLRAQVTDHFLENSTAVADHIALMPEEVTVRGLVAEVVVRNLLPSKAAPFVPRPLPINSVIFPTPTPTLAQKLVRVSTLARILAPGYATQLFGIATSLGQQKSVTSALISADAATLASRLNLGPDAAKGFATAKYLVAATKSSGRPASSTKPPAPARPIPPLTPIVAPALQPDPNSLFRMYLDKAAQPPNQTRQARAVGYVYELFKARQLFTVETAWGTFTDMTLLTARAQQGDETKFLSTLTLTFKKIRTAGTATVSAGQLAGRAAMQSAPSTNDGTAGKQPIDDVSKQSLLYRMLHGP